MPDRQAGSGSTYLDKYVVVLQGGPDFANTTEVTVLVASTHRGGNLRPFEVLCGQGDGFDHDTVIDCRWPFTLRKAEITAGTYRFMLSQSRMHQVALGLVHGLQMRAPTQSPGRPSEGRTEGPPAEQPPASS